MKCEICGKDILKDSQCIDYKYYHNDCIINLTKENKQLKEHIEKYERYCKTTGIKELMENKQLKEENEFLKSEIEEAKRIIQKYLEYINERDERIDKTIKYIESNNEIIYNYEPDYDYEENMVDNYDISNYREDLLKILRGGINE